MKRIAALALLLALAPAVAGAQTAEDLAKQRAAEWVKCVEFNQERHPISDTAFPRAENSMALCEAEEQLAIATLNVLHPVGKARDVAVAEHYKRKVELKKKLNEAGFFKMLEQIGTKK